MLLGAGQASHENRLQSSPGQVQEPFGTAVALTRVAEMDAPPEDKMESSSVSPQCMLWTESKASELGIWRLQFNRLDGDGAHMGQRKQGNGPWSALARAVDIGWDPWAWRSVCRGTRARSSPRRCRQCRNRKAGQRGPARPQRPCQSRRMRPRRHPQSRT